MQWRVSKYPLLASVVVCFRINCSLSWCSLCVHCSHPCYMLSVSIVLPILEALFAHRSSVAGKNVILRFGLMRSVYSSVYGLLIAGTIVDCTQPVVGRFVACYQISTLATSTQAISTLTNSTLATSNIATSILATSSWAVYVP